VGLDGEYPEHAAVAVSFAMHAWIRNKQRYLGGTAAYRLASPFHHAVTAASAGREFLSGWPGQAQNAALHATHDGLIYTASHRLNGEGHALQSAVRENAGTLARMEAEPIHT